MTAGVAIEDLPKTDQNTVLLVCKNISMDYLWIDSLCLIQDDQQDWKEQASRMGDVYENAFVTIAAVAAHNASEGLFRTTPDFRIGNEAKNGMQEDTLIQAKEEAGTRLIEELGRMDTQLFKLV
ncbi:HET domain containing protein [Pyrenophora teres f. maculata]|nr:HET domain containing protein [Pyrenophora teres f. maculata]